MGRAWIVIAVAALAACGGIKEEEDRQKDIGQQTADITSDTQALGDASAAVNEVIRVQDDCEAARPLIPSRERRARHGVRARAHGDGADHARRPEEPAADDRLGLRRLAGRARRTTCRSRARACGRAG